LLYKPAYYDDFQCTAEDCPCNCCHDWEISVDPETARQWRGRLLPEGMQVQRRIRKKMVAIRHMDSLLTGSHRPGVNRKISMNPDGRCPFLDERGLCRIVLTYGDDMLSKTCQTYPREIRTFRVSGGFRREYTLASGCPALLDILWKQDHFQVQEVNETISAPQAQAAAKGPFGAEGSPGKMDIFLLIRTCFLKLAGNPAYKPRTALKLMFLALTDLIGMKAEKGALTLDMVRTYFRNTDFDTACREVEKADVLGKSFSMSEHNNLFQDISVEYRKRKIYTGFLEPLAWLSQEYSVFDEDGVPTEAYTARRAEGKADRNWDRLFADFRSRAGAFEKHFRLLLSNEIYSELVLPETETLEDLMVKLEWMALECGVLMQSLFLTFVKDGQLTYESVRECVYIIIRMTGYSDDDIREYMENSFDDILWPWWYMNDIV